MRKVIYALSVSLDGFIEAANGDLSWGFPDEELHRHFNEREAMIDVQLYGRRLYEGMVAFWPTADEDPEAPEYVVEYARIWKDKPRVVFSTTLDHVESNARLVRENISEVVERLKEQPGEYMSVGGAGLAASCIERGLIDEYWLYVHPVVLGEGKPMFPALRERLTLQLVETQTFGSGVVLLRYRVS